MPAQYKINYPEVAFVKMIEISAFQVECFFKGVEIADSHSLSHRPYLYLKISVFLPLK